MRLKEVGTGPRKKTWFLCKPLSPGRSATAQSSGATTSHPPHRSPQPPPWARAARHSPELRRGPVTRAQPGRQLTHCHGKGGPCPHPQFPGMGTVLAPSANFSGVNRELPAFPFLVRLQSESWSGMESADVPTSLSTLGPSRVRHTPQDGREDSRVGPGPVPGEGAEAMLRGTNDPATAHLPTHCRQDQTSGPPGRLSSLRGHTWTPAKVLSLLNPPVSVCPKLQAAIENKVHFTPPGFGGLFFLISKQERRP